MLLLQQIVNVLLREAGIAYLLCVGGSILADAMPLDEDHRLQQQVGLSRFTLNVIDGRALFYICVKAKDHRVRLRVIELLTSMPTTQIAF